MSLQVKDMTDQWLIKKHFFGIYIALDDGTLVLPNPQNHSQYIPRSVINESIQGAIGTMESLLDVSIKHRERIVEWHNYDKDMWERFAMVNLRRYPVIKVHSMKVCYGENGPVIWDIPASLIQSHGLASKFGMLEILPMWGISANYDPAYAMLFPGVVRAHTAPSLIRVEYDAGMDGIVDADGNPTGLPWDVIKSISLYAAIQPFNVLGDIVLGAGIANFSVSVDGLSQSIGTTLSAENSAYSARIKSYTRELYGQEGIAGVLDIIRKQWRRPSVGLL